MFLLILRGGVVTSVGVEVVFIFEGKTATISVCVLCSVNLGVFCHKKGLYFHLVQWLVHAMATLRLFVLTYYYHFSMTFRGPLQDSITSLSTTSNHRGSRRRSRGSPHRYHGISGVRFFVEMFRLLC